LPPFLPPDPPVGVGVLDALEGAVLDGVAFDAPAVIRTGMKGGRSVPLKVAVVFKTEEAVEKSGPLRPPEQTAMVVPVRAQSMVVTLLGVLGSEETGTR